MCDDNTSNWPKPAGKELIGALEAADYLQIHETTLGKKAKSKEITHYRVGRRLLFDKADLDEYLEQCKVKAE